MSLFNVEKSRIMRIICMNNIFKGQFNMRRFGLLFFILTMIPGLGHAADLPSVFHVRVELAVLESLTEGPVGIIKSYDFACPIAAERDETYGRTLMCPTGFSYREEVPEYIRLEGPAADAGLEVWATLFKAEESFTQSEPGSLHVQLRHIDQLTHLPSQVHRIDRRNLTVSYDALRKPVLVRFNWKRDNQIIAGGLRFSLVKGNADWLDGQVN